MLPALLLALSFAPTNPGTQPGQIREVMLDPSKRLEAPEIKLAPALTATLTFPEPWVSAPACGDCQYGDAENKGQYWRLDIDERTNAISLKFVAVPTSAMLQNPPMTNVNLQLEGGLYVSLVILLTLDPRESDLRVDFRLPEGASSKEQLSARERELEASYQTRVADEASQTLLKALMPGTRCHEYLGSPRRADSLVVRLKEFCQNGRYLYVTFEVENRARDPLSLYGATLTSLTGASNVELRGDAEVPVMLFDKTSLGFNEKTNGIAAIPLEDGAPPPSTYTLTITEDGGRERSIVIDDIKSFGGCGAAGAGPATPWLLAVLLFARRRRR